LEKAAATERNSTCTLVGRRGGAARKKLRSVPGGPKKDGGGGEQVGNPLGKSGEKTKVRQKGISWGKEGRRDTGDLIGVGGVRKSVGA